MNAPADIAVVLVRPKEEGNVGSAARAMANMGLDRLILVEPAAELGRMATAFAVGAKHILESIERKPTLQEALAPFRRIGHHLGPRPAVGGAAVVPPGAARLAGEFPGIPRDTPTALVFGPEVGGLTNDDLALASVLVTIPCSPAQTTLNLAQAVLILAYELYIARGELPPPATVGHPEPPATSGEIDGLVGQATDVLRKIGFDRDDSFEGVLRDLRRLAARASPDSREVAILRGICRRTLRLLERASLPE